jgi:hypothetical protein
MPQEGQVAVNKLTGARATYSGGQWVQAKQAPAEASLRGRLDLGMAPMVQSNETMMSMEKDQNPLNRDWGAAILDNVGVKIGQNDIHPFRPVAKAWGGQDYQDYTQGAAGFESQLMPIMSGAAVSPSEASRQIRSGLPELGDSKETLANKGRTRMMMLNGAAKAKGVPLPYPNVPTYGINSDQVPASGQQAPAPQASGGVPVLTPDQARNAPRGTRFKTTDGRVLVRQ